MSHRISRPRALCSWCANLLALVPLAALAQAPSPELISVGDHKLQVFIEGEGSPAVVFEAGFNGGMLLWRQLQNRIAAHTQTLAYERAGLGRSEPGPTPRSAGQIARELHALLVNTKVSKPIILVGHSAGGMFVRVYAHDFPHDIAALVLVDPATEGYYRRMQTDTAEQWASASKQMPDGMRLQWEALPESMREASRAWPLPKVPVVMVTAGTAIGSWPLATSEDMQVWFHEHDALAQRIPHAVHITILTRAFVEPARWEIEIAGQRFAARASLAPLYDPRLERVKV